MINNQSLDSLLIRYSVYIHTIQEILQNTHVDEANNVRNNLGTKFLKFLSYKSVIPPNLSEVCVGRNPALGVS